MAAPTLVPPGATPAAKPVRLRGKESRVAGRSRVASGLFNLLGLAYALIMFFPIYWMINTAFKPANEVLTFTPRFWPSHPTLVNFDSAIHALNFLPDLGNSLIITGIAVAGGLVVGFLGALALARFKFLGRRAMLLAILIVQMVPTLALLIPLFIMLDTVNLTDTLIGVALVYLVQVLPYTVWVLRAFIVNVPRELDEAAMVDGCNRWQVFWRIILPLTGPGLVASAIYGFIQCWNEFIIISTLNRPEHQNLMTWLAGYHTQRGTAWGPLMAGAILASLPVVILFLMIQKHVAAGMTAGAVKG